MKTVKYQVVVDPDVDYPSEKFKELVQIYVADPNGWESKGYRFVYSPKGDVVIHLSSQHTMKTSGCFDAMLSCAEMNGKHMKINEYRWKHGSSKSRLVLEKYRQYVISHEMGHILGHDHEQCPAPGAPAPIMMQQTQGIGKCLPNTDVSYDRYDK
jgi:hypothetical protein